MSDDGKTPRNSPSADYISVSKLKDRGQLWVWIMGLIALSIPPIMWVTRLPTESRVEQLINRSIKAHEGKSAHHGVVGMIQTYAAPKSEVIRLGVRLEASTDRYRRILQRLDKIDGKIDDMRGHPRASKR